MHIASFNVEKLDDRLGQCPALATRVAIMRPQIERLRADVLCLPGVHSQGPSGALRRDAHFPESDHAAVVAAFETVTAV